MCRIARLRESSSQLETAVFRHTPAARPHSRRISRPLCARRGGPLELVLDAADLPLEACHRARPHHPPGRPSEIQRTAALDRPRTACAPIRVRRPHLKRSSHHQGRSPPKSVCLCHLTHTRSVLWLSNGHEQQAKTTQRSLDDTKSSQPAACAEPCATRSRSHVR